MPEEFDLKKTQLTSRGDFDIKYQPSLYFRCTNKSTVTVEIRI